MISAEQAKKMANDYYDNLGDDAKSQAEAACNERIALMISDYAARGERGVSVDTSEFPAKVLACIINVLEANNYTTRYESFGRRLVICW